MMMMIAANRTRDGQVEEHDNNAFVAFITVFMLRNVGANTRQYDHVMYAFMASN